jgi:hypothetical protein
VSLFEELKRRNVFRVGIAYVMLGWVVLQGRGFHARSDWRARIGDPGVRGGGGCRAAVRAVFRLGLRDDPGMPEKMVNNSSALKTMA